MLSYLLSLGPCLFPTSLPSSPSALLHDFLGCRLTFTPLLPPLPCFVFSSVFRPGLTIRPHVGSLTRLHAPPYRPSCPPRFPSAVSITLSFFFFLVRFTPLPPLALPLSFSSVSFYLWHCHTQGAPPFPSHHSARGPLEALSVAPLSLCVLHGLRSRGFISFIAQSPCCPASLSRPLPSFVTSHSGAGVSTRRLLPRYSAYRALLFALYRSFACFSPHLVAHLSTDSTLPSHFGHVRLSLPFPVVSRDVRSFDARPCHPRQSLVCFAVVYTLSASGDASCSPIRPSFCLARVSRGPSVPSQMRSPPVICIPAFPAPSQAHTPCHSPARAGLSFIFGTCFPCSFQSPFSICLICGNCLVPLSHANNCPTTPGALNFSSVLHL